ncbi:MAG TPA: hypothetical protein VGC74_01260 [Stenotrophomonas sp.]|jgi:hypothetical protein
MADPIAVPDSKDTFSFAERAHDLRLVLPVLSLLLAADLALQTILGSNILSLSWPLPKQIGLGGGLTFVAAYLFASGLLMPIAVGLLKSVAYRVDSVLTRVNLGFMFPSGAAHDRDAVSPWQLHRHAVRSKCEFARSLAESALEQAHSEAEAARRLLQASGACLLWYALDVITPGSTVRVVGAAWPSGWLLVPGVLLGIVWASSLRDLMRQAAPVYYPELAPKDDRGPPYRRRNARSTL